MAAQATGHGGVLADDEFSHFNFEELAGEFAAIAGNAEGVGAVDAALGVQAYDEVAAGGDAMDGVFDDARRAWLLDDDGLELGDSHVASQLIRIRARAPKRGSV